MNNEEKDQVEDQLPKNTHTDQVQEPRQSKKKHFPKLRHMLSTKKGKTFAILGILALVIGVLYAVPSTRYGIIGQFVKKPVAVVVIDSTTKKPVTEATVSVAGLEAKTDDKGRVTIGDVPVGEYQLTVKKKYYQDKTEGYNVPIFTGTNELSLVLNATGRQVGVSVVNGITKLALAKAQIVVGETSAITDSEGKATIVLPTDKPTLKGKVKLEGYNDAEVEVSVTDQLDANTFAVTPAGSVYYLSKATGKIDVMKSDLDGKNQQVVVKATGNESDSETVLLASRDWKFLALFAKRDGDKKGQLFLVNTTTGKLTTIDEAVTATFQPVGWSGHRFVYLVDRDRQPWEDKQRAMKSFDADTAKTVVLDETQGYGDSYNHYQREYLLGAYVVGDTVAYAKQWSSTGYGSMASKKSAIYAVKADGNQKQTLREFTAQNYINIDGRAYEPKGIYYKVDIDGAEPSFYEFENGKVEQTSSTTQKFYAQYPTYLVSPDSEMTVWSEPRNGKTAVIVGDDVAENKKELAAESEYSAFGWYSDQYVLVSKNGSELFIAAKDQTFADNQPIKITNYHKPALTYPGYGYGYGGI